MPASRESCDGTAPPRWQAGRLSRGGNKASVRLSRRWRRATFRTLLGNRIPGERDDARHDELDHGRVHADDVGHACGPSGLGPTALGEVTFGEQVRRDRVCGRHDLGGPRSGTGQGREGHRSAPGRRQQPSRLVEVGPGGRIAASRPRPSPPVDPGGLRPPAAARPAPRRAADAGRAGRRATPDRARPPATPADHGARGGRVESSSGTTAVGSARPGQHRLQRGLAQLDVRRDRGQPELPPGERGESARDVVAGSVARAVRDRHQPHDSGTASR